MASESGNSGFVERFERAMTGADERLRSLETGQAEVKQEMKSLKEDRCDKHDRAIEELYASRNALERTVEQLKGSATGLTKICESLDSTVDALDKRALLLGAGEKGVVNQLDTINKWNTPQRLQDLELKVGTLESEKTEAKKDTKGYKMLLYGALIGAIFSILSGLVVFFLTTGG